MLVVTFGRAASQELRARVREQLLEAAAALLGVTSADVVASLKRYGEITARGKGFLMVSSSPLTRSSYHAGDDFRRMREAREAKLAGAAASQD